MTYGISYLALRYANVYGPRQNPHGEAGVVAIFTRKLLRGEDAGDQRRRQADARLRLSSATSCAPTCSRWRATHCGALNIGTGIETDVNSLFGLLQREIGSAAPEQHGPAKPGEQARSVLDPAARPAGAGLAAARSISPAGLRHTVEYFRERRRSGEPAP